MRSALAALTLWLLTPLCNPCAAASAPALRLDLAASVLRVEAPRAQGGYALGSAVVVEAERVVTNCHVTRDARAIHVVRDGRRWTASAQASDVARDLCLLQVPGLPAPPVALGRAGDLALGQPVEALGYTGGMAMQGSSGQVVGLHRHDDGRIIQSTNWFSSGASGGGLFDTQGRLVGILTFRLRGGESHYFAAPVDWVRQLLVDRGRGAFVEVMPQDASRLSYWQSPAAQQPRFMQAALLMRQADWPHLANYARGWLGQVADDAEPWRLLGMALEQLDRPLEARAAFECSLRLVPAQPGLRSHLEALPLGTAANSGPLASRAQPCRPGTI